MAERSFSDTTNVAVLAALLFFTFATYFASFVDMGWLNTPVGIAISVCKAALVVLYFMHARYSRWLTWVVIVSAIFWVGILFVLTMSDYLSRGW
jgi:cytochrome c oxidase subunit 4